MRDQPDLQHPITRCDVWGLLDDGRAVDRVTLRRGAVEVEVVALGAAIQAIRVPDRDGRIADVTIGHATPARAFADRQFFGATTGRYANRIADAAFTLDGTPHALEANAGRHHLHGGDDGLDRQLWAIERIDPDAGRVALRHVSPDGAAGYPGALDITASYTLDEAGALTLTYRATTTRSTIVNVTNHAFFNLSGGVTDALDHRVTIHASAFTPVDAGMIPTGERRAVAGTAFDFRTGRVVGASIRDGRDEQLRIGRGYDHNFIVDGDAGQLRSAVRVEHGNGRILTIDATAPGLQFYSGNFLDGSVTGKDGRIYRMGDALCFEPQHFPDAPNRPDFPSARLDPGQPHETVMRYRFSVAR